MRLATRTSPAPKPCKNRQYVAALALAALLSLPACYPVTGGRAYCELTRHDPALPVERSKNVPMMRIGSLPHPFGPIPVRYGDPNDLGTHTIRHSAFRSIRLGEASGGIIYTQRVGFIDLAHTRNAADLTWASYQRIRPALAESRPRVLLAGAEPSLFLVHLDYPPGWAAMPPAVRDRVVDHVALLLAVRMGYIISTWHEVLTSFGFHGVAGIPEQQSAFAYDDQPSHLLGAVAAGRAIEHVQSGETTYNDAMTAALAQLLEEYGAMDTAGTRTAVAAAKGLWWDLDQGSIRQIHLGMQGETFTPILLGPQSGASTPVSAAPSDTDSAPPDAAFTWQVPALSPPPGAAADDRPALHARVTIDPRTRYADDLYDAVGIQGPWLDLDRDGPALKQHIQERFNAAP